MIEIFLDFKEFGMSKNTKVLILAFMVIASFSMGCVLTQQKKNRSIKIYSSLFQGTVAITAIYFGFATYDFQKSDSKDEKIQNGHPNWKYLDSGKKVALFSYSVWLTPLGITLYRMTNAQLFVAI
ncbi:hypothetical protein [Oenococcus oeni]